MRILHMIPDIGVANGVMSVILNYAKAMPENVIFDVLYFQETDENRKADIEALGGRVFKVDRPSPKDLLTKKYALFFKSHKGEWQALHIHAPHFAVFIAPAAKKSGINKICVHSHTTEYSLKSSSLRNKILSYYAKLFIRDKFACSKESGKIWYGNKHYTVLKNAIDTKAYSFNPEKREEVRASFNIGDSFVLGHIGRTDIPQKNHSFILEIFSEICKIHPDSRLVLIGAENNSELTELAKRFKITERVIYLGFRSDVSMLLQMCDLFLFPSVREGLPVSVVEAQAAGLPVLLSDTVTDEVVVLDSTVFLSIESPAYEWAKKALEYLSFNRTDTYENMKESGWEILIQAEELLNYYNGD